MGSGQSEIQAFEADEQEAYDESRGTKENCSSATEKMGTGEGEEGQLSRHRLSRTYKLSRPRGHPFAISSVAVATHHLTRQVASMRLDDQH